VRESGRHICNVRADRIVTCKGG